MISADKLAIVSGIGPSLAGTGRLIASLLDQAKNAGVDLIFVKAPYTWSEIEGVWRSQSKVRALKMCLGWLRQWILQFRRVFQVLIEKDREMIIFHPQNLGMFMTTFLFSWKRGPMALFLLDSSFFCLRSYNHVPGERGPCLRCVGDISKEVSTLNCRSFPNLNWYNIAFLKRLRRLASKKTFRILAQNRSQAELATRHFGPAARIEVAGMWTPEFDHLSEGLSLWDNPSRLSHQETSPWIVFHGHNLGAKGANWCMELAKETACVASKFGVHPQFLFPFPSPGGAPPANAHFLPLSWETGLKEKIESCAAVIVPSLWSACIEGSLIKSLGHGKLVFAVENATSFSSEIPSPVLLTLSNDPKKAATELLNALSRNWSDLGKNRRGWFSDFRGQKDRLWKALTTPSFRLNP